jgi:hypothetical protein
VGSRETNLDREIQRYQQAATLALEQLEWAIAYLHRLQKRGLAMALERNRQQITHGLPH